MLVRVWAKWNPQTLLVEVQISKTLWKAVWKPLKNLIRELPYDPATPLLGIYLKYVRLQ
jgi:hypothetical protein